MMGFCMTKLLLSHSDRLCLGQELTAWSGKQATKPKAGRQSKTADRFTKL